MTARRVGQSGLSAWNPHCRWMDNVVPIRTIESPAAPHRNGASIFGDAHRSDRRSFGRMRLPCANASIPVGRRSFNHRAKAYGVENRIPPPAVPK